MANIGYQACGTGSVFTTPDAVALRITGDLDLYALVQPVKWAGGQGQPIIWKSDNSANGYIGYSLNLYNDGGLRFGWSTDGTTATTVNASAITGGTDGVPLWVRATRVASTGAVNFFKSSEALISGVPTNWTQIGETQSGATGAGYAATAIVRLGYDRMGGGTLLGKIYAARIMSGVGGTVVASPDLRASSGGVQSYTDAQSNVWSTSLRGGVAIEPGGGGIIRTGMSGGML